MLTRLLTSFATSSSVHDEFWVFDRREPFEKNKRSVFSVKYMPSGPQAIRPTPILLYISGR